MIWGFIHERISFEIENGDILNLSFFLQFFCGIDYYLLRADYVQDTILWVLPKLFHNDLKACTS